jgi:hypothetical protein
MTQQYSFPGPSGVTDQYAARKDLAGLFARNAAGAVRWGVLPRSNNALVIARADMQVDVGAFEAVAVQFGGPILIANDAVAQVAIAVAPPSNSRIDVVYVKQNENAAPATDADNSLQLAAATGVASASPVKPAIPAGAVELATVLVPAGKTATNQSGVVITQTVAFTAASGGVMMCRTPQELAAWTPMDGHLAWSMSEGVLYSRQNAAWVPLAPTLSQLGIQRGQTAVAASGVTAITFPTAYAAPPIVEVTVVISGGTVSIAYIGALPTATGFQVRIYSLAAAQIAGTVDWIAVPA